MEEHQRRVHPWRKEVVAGSIDFNDCSNEESLCRKLRQALDARVSIERQTDWGLSRVPTLRSEGVWADDHQNIYWRAFTSFCRWPSPKEHARLEAYDSQSTPASLEARRLVLFFRQDLLRLSISIKTENQPRAHSRVISEVSLQELSKIETFEDAMRMESRPPS